MTERVNLQRETSSQLAKLKGQLMTGTVTQVKGLLCRIGVRPVLSISHTAIIS